VAGKVAAAEKPESVTARTWLMRLARDACAARLSGGPARSSHGRGGLARPSFESASRTPEAEARHALAALRPTEREAVVLSMVGGLDAAEVARACAITLDEARGRIARGLAALSAAERESGKGSR
jgi:RNA polymerase sigma-70 factor, ECF subfamily